MDIFLVPSDAEKYPFTSAFDALIPLLSHDPIFAPLEFNILRIPFVFPDPPRVSVPPFILFAVKLPEDI